MNSSQEAIDVGFKRQNADRTLILATDFVFLTNEWVRRGLFRDARSPIVRMVEYPAR